MCIRDRSTVVGADGKVNRAFIGGLADQAAVLRKLGWRLVVVSSGAIACGYPVDVYKRQPMFCSSTRPLRVPK